MRRSGRREFLKTITISAGAILAGCSHQGSRGGITLNQWYHQYGETGTHDAVIRYAQQYTQIYPNVHIQVTWIPGDYHTKLSTALLTRGGPDIFEDQLSVPMVTAGQVVAVDSLFTPAVRADFNPRDLAMNTVGNKIYGVKMLDDTGVLYYRKSLMQTADLDLPTTMDELIAAAKKLTTDQRKGLFVGNDGGIAALVTLLPWSAGSDFLVNNKIVFDNDRTIAAYQKLKDLNDAGCLLIGAPTDWWDPSAFTQDLAAMQYSGLWAYPAIKKALGEDVGGMAWPAIDPSGEPVTFLGGWTEMINAQGSHVEEAMKFVSWLWIENTKDQLDWCLSYGFHVPPRLSLARNAAALQKPLPALAVKNLEEHGKLLPPAWSSSMGTILSDAVTNIVKKGDPPGPEVANAARQCERELERLLE